MWYLGAGTLVIGLLSAILELLRDQRPIDDDDDWIVGYPIDPLPTFDPWDFGPWKGRKEDEWVIVGVLTFLVLQSKFWK